MQRNRDLFPAAAKRMSVPSCGIKKETFFQKSLRFLFDHPVLRKPIWKFWYSFAARLDGKAANLRFMNFGYAPSQGKIPALDLDPADETHRSCIQMYYHTVGEQKLTGQDVLEVGCGRGGGAASLMKYARPGSLRAMDLSPQAVRLNEKAYHIPGLSFLQGDAERIPFPDSSFDAVVNVESSHCYPRLPLFFLEVARVLRPKGRLFYADFRRIADLAGWEQAVAASGFLVREKEDITADVVRALDLDSRRKEDLIMRKIPRFLHPAFHKFVCTAGSENYTSLVEGRRFYFRYLLVKP